MSTTRTLAAGDPAYPRALDALGSPTLFLRGALPDAPGVAVVGTRQASQAAMAFTRSLARELAGQGIVVWSGGAIGIDAAAHEGALDAGGLSVLVAAGGLDRPYPRAHRPLFARVIERGGALLARVPDGTPPVPPLFLMRNELIAALTLATVVIEAGLQSGARSTAAAARRLGRPLCVVPHPPWEERGAGCALELTLGAIPVTSAAGVLAAIGRPPPPRRQARSRRARPAEADTLPLPLPDPPLEPAEAAIYAVLGSDPRHFDEACERSGLTVPAVTGALLTLTLRAVVVEGPAGFFRRCLPQAPP